MAYLPVGLSEMDWRALLMPVVVCCITFEKFCWK
jgi:hypothetical protein